jgi:tight adherence protein B
VTATTATLSIGVALGVVLLALRLRVWATTPSRLPVTSDGDGPGAPPRSVPWRRPRPLDELAVAGWCDHVGAGLRSGRSLSAAVVEADTATTIGGPRPFPDVVLAVRRGRSLADAFRAVADDPSTPTGLAAPVLATCADLGGSSAGPLEGIADVLVARADERAERMAASAQARLSARVMTTVPFGVAGLLAVAEPSVRHAIGSPAGLACVGGGALLNLTGWWWMRTMIRGAS